MSNGVAQINAKAYVKWRYVGTEQNPSDVGSRGTLSRELLKVWLKGPNWLSKPQMWLAVAQTKPCKETEAVANLLKEVFAGATEMEDTLH